MLKFVRKQIIGGGWILSDPKFLTDRMLGKLTTWLRILGYDVLYVGDLNVEGDEDVYLLKHHKNRILLTKDRQLHKMCMNENRSSILIKSNDVSKQLLELKNLINFKPVMSRCSVCNSLLRKPNKEEIRDFMERENIQEDLAKRYELWYCEKCKKLYWMGGHWKNMLKFLSKLKS